MFLLHLSLKLLRVSLRFHSANFLPDTKCPLALLFFSCTMPRAPLRMRRLHVNSATAQAAMAIFLRRCFAFSPALGRSPQTSLPHICKSAILRLALNKTSSNDDELTAYQLFCETFLPLAPCFSSPQRKVSFAAAVMESHSSLFHSQSSRTNSDSNPQIPPRALALAQAHVFFFSQLLHLVTTCNFELTGARILLKTQAQDTAGGCGVRGCQHVKRLTILPALQKVSVSYSRSDRYTQTCFHCVVALPGVVKSKHEQTQFTFPI